MKRIRFLSMIVLCSMFSVTIYSQVGLSALLQEVGSQEVGPQGVGPQEASPTVSTAPTAPGLSALLASSTTPSTPSVAPVDLETDLLQQFMTAQSNPLYAQAMSILSDQSLKVAYSNALLSIQLFLMQYASNTLSKLAAQSAQVDKPSLSALLATAIATSGAPTTHLGVIGLSSLLSAAQGTIQSVADQPVASRTQQNSIAALLEQMSASTTVVPVAKKSKVGLQNLLDAVAAPVVSSSFVKDSLSNLLAIQS